MLDGPGLRRPPKFGRRSQRRSPRTPVTRADTAPRAWKGPKAPGVLANARAEADATGSAAAEACGGNRVAGPGHRARVREPGRRVERTAPGGPPLPDAERAV